VLKTPRSGARLRGGPADVALRLQEMRLVLEEVGEGQYLQAVTLFFNDAFFGKSGEYSPGGLYFAAGAENPWGSLRNAAFLASAALRAAEVSDRRADTDGQPVQVRAAPRCAVLVSCAGGPPSQQ
jgi:hypothetical protein